MTEFRENILDILDNWGITPGTGLVAPRDSCGFPAFNSGHVQLRCYINNTCPFYKTPKTEESLIFNTETIAELNSTLPSSVFSVLTTTPGLEGMHFKPRKAFRHTYMYRWDPIIPEAQPEQNDGTTNEWRNIMSNWDDYYKDISIGRFALASVVGADKTRYKEEQSWYTTHSVFDHISCTNDREFGCEVKSNWSYIDKAMSRNYYTDDDIRYDYKNAPGTGDDSTRGYYNDYLDSFKDNGRELKDEDEDGNKEIIRIKRYSIQMPEQNKIRGSLGAGVHWKVTKRTPIFKGEDFFIRFYKKAQETTNYDNIKNPVSFTRGSFYAPLDVKEKNTVIVDTPTGTEKDINDAIRLPKKNNTDKDILGSTYEFFTQAYYIIELNKEYFIVIPERGNPIFIHFFKGENSEGVVSKILGEPFDGISGEKLIKSNWFDVVVRNHLGRMVVQFEGDFPTVKPWIIERNDWVFKQLAEGEEASIEEEIKELTVPRGSLSIWGGNIRTGFLFGPLQYQTSYLSFLYPPRDANSANTAGGSSTIKLGHNNDEAFNSVIPKEVELSSGYFRSNPLWLPMNGPKDDEGNVDYKFSFEASDEDKYDEEVIFGDSQPEFSGQKLPLFTQDAQFYKNYNDDSDGYKLGRFFNNKPIRDFSDEVGTLTVKTSNIIIHKYKYLNDKEVRKQGFNTMIGMMAGDHVFTDAHWLGGSPPIADVADDTEANAIEMIEDSVWYLPDCKTPIITAIRLIAKSSSETRWDDGTTVKEGVRRDPETQRARRKTSQYFIDATDHVMSFNHSWSSTLKTMEHNGSIQFYLNRDMNVSNNVTDRLFNLKDKNFYIEIWGGYEPVGFDDSPCNYTRIHGFYKMFTGLCQGGNISYEYGKHVMTCKLEDYSVVLKGMKFFNSPWFDGMKDVVAINEIMQFAGFRDEGKYDPGVLIKGMSARAIDGDDKLFNYHIDGRVYKYDEYALPAGYSRLEQPAFKFNDGDSFIDAIVRIGSVSSKMFYFDEFGIAHFEDFQDMVEEDFLNKFPLESLYSFTTNPEIHGGQLMFNKVERSFDMDMVVNHIKIISNTPNLHRITLDKIKWDSIENPELNGFLGYQKTGFQAESMFGSRQAVEETARKYSVAFKPKINVKFETYGLPLRATDIIDVEGEQVRVLKVDHTIEAEANRWWMQVECERYQPIDEATLGGGSPL